MEKRRLLPQRLRPGLKIVFVGAAASLHSAQAGHWYAGPTNRFYTLLWQAGFTPRQLLPEEDALLLEYGIGLTCLHPTLSSPANHLLPEATEAMRQEMKNSLQEASPCLVCYNGKDVFRMCTGEDALRWGLQPEGGSGLRQFVTISTSGRADRWGYERLELFRELKELVEHECGGS